MFRYVENLHVWFQQWRYFKLKLNALRIQQERSQNKKLCTMHNANDGPV